MAIRMSGLQSGLDTETLVAALVSTYTVQKENLVKAQTKLSWKQDAWKSMNTSIYSFYSGKLSSARLSASYNLKTSSISDSTKAKVTASSSAVNGTQTLEVTQLAATGYLTGGVVSKSDGTKYTGSSKVSDITGVSDGAITVDVDGTSTDINITSDMTIDQFVSKLKETGLNASFDETNQRFFVSSKTSGASHDFSLRAKDANGMTSLQNMKIYTENSADTAKYAALAQYTDAQKEAEVQSRLAEKQVNASDRARTYADKYNTAIKTIKEIEADSSWDSTATVDSVESAFKSKYSALITQDADGNDVYDTASLSEDELKAFNDDKAAMESSVSLIKRYNSAVADKTDAAQYVVIGDDGETADAEQVSAAVQSQVDDENAVTEAALRTQVQSEVDYAKSMFETDDVTGDLKTDATGNLVLKSAYKSGSNDGSGAVRVYGEDAIIKLNGATYTNNTNSFSINGLTVEAMAKTDGAVTITTNTDVDGIYNSIKSFLKEYNTLITAMDTAYNADSASGYEPLTSDEKDAMSDDEVEKWETKIKDSLLRKDSILGNASSSMKNLMASAIEVNGKKYSLSSFGIATLGYFSSAENEKGVYHIDGDSDDSSTSGNDDKLRSMIASDPDVVISFFSQLATKVYTDLGNRMASSSTSSAFTIYNDKQMETEYSTYTTKISDKEDEISTWEDYYYDKFSSMETALAKLNSTQSSLSGYFS